MTIIEGKGTNEQINFQKKQTLGPKEPQDNKKGPEYPKYIYIAI